MQHASLVGTVAIVTGASSGIGRATCLALANQGASLVLASRNRAALEALREGLAEGGTQAIVVETDVSCREQVNTLVEATLARWGRIDVLIANAGVYLRRPVRELAAPEIEHVMAVNFHGAVNCILAVLPQMLERRSGHIVVVSSMDGKKGLPREAAYVASKFALTGFAEVLRQEAQGTGVTVSTVLPGRVDTPLIKDLQVPWISAKMPPERVAKRIVETIRQPRAEVLLPFVGAKALILVNALSPRLGDLAVRWLGLSGEIPTAGTPGMPGARSP